jgi:hypothetical protein
MVPNWSSCEAKVRPSSSSVQKFAWFIGIGQAFNAISISLFANGESCQSASAVEERDLGSERHDGVSATLVGSPSILMT